MLYFSGRVSKHLNRQTGISIHYRGLSYNPFERYEETVGFSTVTPMELNLKAITGHRSWTSIFGLPNTWGLRLGHYHQIATSKNLLKDWGFIRIVLFYKRLLHKLTPWTRYRPTLGQCYICYLFLDYGWKCFMIRQVLIKLGASR